MPKPGLLAASCSVAFLAGAVVSILYAAGVAEKQMPAIAFVLGTAALATGLPALVQWASRWGVPGDGG
ncbi:MAG: hypothetical protein ACRDTP_04710 [Mycobacteriales bacterium]